MDIYALWMIQTIYGAKGISSVRRGTLSSCSSHFASYTGPLFIAMGGVYAQINIPHQTTDRPLHYKDGRPTGCRKNVDYHHGCTEVLISCVVNDVERVPKPDHTSFVFQTCGSHRQWAWLSEMNLSTWKAFSCGKKKIQPTYRAMRISSLICPQTCIWRNVLERLNRNYKNDSNARSRRVPDWFVPSDEETAEKDNVDNFNDDIDISAGIHIGNDMNSSTLHHFDALSILLRLWPHDVQTPRCTDARQHSIDDLNLQCWRFISIK